MATVIRIKRRHDEEPTESIIVKTKRARVEENEEEAAARCETSLDSSHTIMTRVGTMDSKEEDLQKHVLNIMKDYKKGWELREQYKKLGNAQKIKVSLKQDNKERVSSKRYKIVTAYRGIQDEVDLKLKDGKGHKGEDEEDKAKKDEISPLTANKFKLYDAMVAELEKKDDVITCNGIPMETEKYVYDIYYTPQPFDWIENICEIEKYTELYFGSDSDDDLELQDEDDENDESNWRNDYPDESDDSNYEDEMEYLNAQIRKVNTKTYDTDESYDVDDYEEDFDDEGNLIECGYVDGGRKFRRQIRELASSDDSDSD